jgi:hypothetical protein
VARIESQVPPPPTAGGDIITIYEGRVASLDLDTGLTAGGSPPAPNDAQYVVLAADGDLTVERILTAGTGISVTDGGAGSTVTIACDADASEITFTPAVATDWDGDADPGDLDDALNQLAERTDDLEAAPPAHVHDSDDVTYTPTTLTDWDSDADPGDVEQALDQLAERTDDLEAAPPAHVHDASVVTYTPAVATDWDADADPGDVDNALDQLAERVDDIEAVDPLTAAEHTAIGDGAPHHARYTDTEAVAAVEAEASLNLHTAVTVGDADVRSGSLVLYGHGAGEEVGGSFEIETSADYDAAIEKWLIRAYEDDLEFSGSVLALRIKADNTIEAVAGPLQLDEIAAPAATVDTVKLYAKDKAGVANLYFKKGDGTEVEIGAAGGGGDVATDAIWDAKGDLAGGTGANTADNLTVGANDTVLMAASGETTGLKWANKATVLAAINVEDGADVTDAANVNTAGAVMESDFDAQTILAATADNTPAALTVAEQRIVGRKTGGNIAALTAAEIITMLAMDADDIPYTATTNADWDGAASPSHAEAAFDQLAERVRNRHLWVSAKEIGPSTGTGALMDGCAYPARREYTTNGLNPWYCAFDPATDEAGEFDFVLPVWDGGTLTATVHWTTVAAAGTTVKWMIQAAARDDNDPLDDAWGAAAACDADTVLAAGDEHRIVSAAITPDSAGTAAAGDHLYFRIYRDVSEDNCASDADLLGVLIGYNRRDA